MQKEKFITVMAIFDEDTQNCLQSIGEDFEKLYGVDTKTKGIPFHITLGSYAVEETDEITTRIIDTAKRTKEFKVKFSGLKHFGNVLRYIMPEMNEELMNLHLCFESDYANGFHGWKPHVTVYRHSEPKKIELPKQITDKIEKIKNARIVGIELGEFFPPKQIIRVFFGED